MPDAGMLLVDTELHILRRPAALADFLHLQELHIGDVTDALKSDWILKVSSVVGWLLQCSTACRLQCADEADRAWA